MNKKTDGSGTEHKGKRIGLALGGGGARGLAHIGVIKVLQEANIPIHAIAGTSMGALVGSWYAVKGEVDSLQEIFLSVRSKDMAPLTSVFLKHEGVIFKNKEISNIVESGVKGKKFKDCLIPFAAVATDVRNGDEVVFKEGDLAEAVHASIAVPFAFPPVESKSKKKLLMDGGLVDPVPADIVKEMDVDFVIAVDVTQGWINITEEKIELRKAYRMIDRVMTAIESEVARQRLKSADMILRPAVSSFDWLDFPEASQIITAGDREARLSLKDIYEKTGYTAPPKSGMDKFIDFILYRG